MKKWLALGCLFVSGWLHAEPLPPDVLAALKLAKIPTSHIGVIVKEVGAHNNTIELNPSQPMNPASTMKLLTTYAALELLGPAYTWKTEAYLDGELDNAGVLHGNLVLKGYGDPKLTLEQFWLWLHELRQRGLREITGGLILDRSAFDLPPHDPYAFDGDGARAYNVGPDALLLNFNAIRFRFFPNGSHVGVVTEPQLGGIVLDNRLTRVQDGVCSDWNDRIRVRLNGTALTVVGEYPVHCGERDEYLNLLPNSDYALAVFRSLWLEMGGSLHGSVRNERTPSSARLFSAHYSSPLAEQIRDINKFSNNVMARQLFLTLGMQSAPSTLAGSELILRNWLRKKNLHFPELQIENGAGLARSDRISPQHMAQLLESVLSSPYQAEYEASLPIIGVDGTVKKRLNGSGVAQHAHLKTGTLGGVKAIAGYVHTQSGKQYILVFLINHPAAGAGQAAQDALVHWVWQNF